MKLSSSSWKWGLKPRRGKTGEVRPCSIQLIIIVIEVIKAALGDGTEEQKMRTKYWENAFKE